MFRIFINGLFFLFLMAGLTAQENLNKSKFKQLGHELPTPNVYRTGAGAPGHQYWQQRADYVMDITIDDEKQRLLGEETITYTNNSPDQLDYLWVQLDQNVRHPDSDAHKIRRGNIERMGLWSYKRLFNHRFEGGFNVEHVKDASGNDIQVAVNKTMMRIDLDKPLKTGESYTFSIKWDYNINDRMQIGGRSGYEYFEKDDNYLYTIAQFFPRMCVYDDVNGWQNKQFLGRGEFALPFGDYDVKITVPADHVVGATGELQNPGEVLTQKQQDLLEEAKTADKPVIIVSQKEAEANEKEKSTDTKTWHYKAENVRDYGFANSRKFIWDAQGVDVGGKTVMAMSLYPKEGNPLWEQYSTKAVVLTLEVFSRHTFDYPYPVAYSVHTANIGMEYPMICFNFGRPDEDGTYSDRTKYGMIGVIIHEIGHNYFPMIVNSDERQWTWMDEGLNTFLQFITEKEWTDETGEPFPSRRGPPAKIVDYMKGDKKRIMPIMTNSESIIQFGANAYAKPATALNILRETVMGKELFDFAFKQYSQRWMFKHPEPADFFRTMEDASGVDLDWFWRGWFYSTDHVDISIDDVRKFNVKIKSDEELEKEILASTEDAAVNEVKDKKKKKKRKKEKEVEVSDSSKPGFFDPIKYNWRKGRLFTAEEYKENYDQLSDYSKALLATESNFYQLDFTNVGGLVMPLILDIEFTDGSREEHRIPAEIWRFTGNTTNKVFITKKEIARVVVDPNLETADTDLSNNSWPKDHIPSRFEEFLKKKDAAH